MGNKVSDFFNQAASLWGYFENSILFEFTKIAVPAAAGFIGKSLIDLRKQKKQLKAIKTGNFKSHTASVVQLTYLPIEKSDNVLQWQHRLGQVDIESVFPDKIRDKAYEYIREAMELCTHEEPLVFEKLKNIAPEDDYKQIRDAIRNYWRSYFSSKMSKESNVPSFSNLKLRSGYEPEKQTYVAALVYDPDSSVRELRILWLTEKQVKNVKFIHKDKVIVERPNCLVIDEQLELDDPKLQWVDLYNNALSQLSKSQETLDLSEIGILTGKSVKITVPSLTL